MAIWVNSWECDLVKFAKAYLLKEGTTTDKCASSAESDVFIQAVALLDAVIPPDSPKMWPARLVTASDGNNRFRNESFGLTANKI